MQLTDERLIRAHTDTVWRAILDPAVLKACIPGCESLTGSPETGYEAVVLQKIGPVSARFTGVVSLSDLRPGEGLTLSGEGKGGAAGFAKGSAQVGFAPEGDGTRLTYTVDANVGGKIAQLGSRLIDSFAKKLADQFFERFQMAVEGPEEEPAEAEGEAPTEKKGWFKRLVGG
ncbi:carbon monoxide dehydrogenase subunit G [Frigidibacter sp. RF13]|uniref:SRPBCC family protein n=1 Tax=Frigidibacter sp. RF13 TaxID=2997340 RepID=UPI002270D265|nr:carbon monoxide dehydrogenase subunit G [Frigidibacter sp. RF13]MCY1125997.1 carbon monoxide dehydrogenase subunit G [Frigidibacter sp. RF13]